MGNEILKVLLIEDNPGDSRLIREMLSAASCGRIMLEEAATLTDGLSKLTAGSFGAVLLDLSLAETQGIETFRAVHQQSPAIPVVVLTGSNDEALAAEALKAGAQDYLVKGQVDRNLLARSIRYAVERGRTEEQLRQRAIELAESGRRKDEFLAILSHELRNPLSPLIAAAEILRKPKLDDSERQWAQGMIERQVHTMSRLVDDLLDISRISRGNITLRKEPMDLTVAVRHAVEATRPLFEKSGQQLAVSLPDEPLRVHGDMIRLEQVMMNLLTNANKYTSPGGRIWIRASVQAGQVVISVQDNGIGIPPDMLERIFELFTRVDSSSNRSSQWGMGVGLALVRGLVELHGGKIKAVSLGRGRGSEFVMNLPLSPEIRDRTQAGNESRPKTEPPNGRPCKVLIAEDHADTAQCMARMAQLWKHEVRVVDTGPAALEAAREFAPDVILLDIGLPGMDGFEVVRKLREQAMFGQTPILALSGYGREEDRQHAAEAGFTSHLTKPVEPETLRNLLATQGREI